MSWEATLYAQNVCRLMDRSGRAVLNALAWRAAKETPAFVFMKREDIYAATGIADKKTVKNAIARLEKAGEVKVLKVGGIRENGKRESTDFELVGVRQWLAAGKPSREQWEGPKPEEPRGENFPQAGENLTPIGTFIGNHSKEGGEKNPRANAPRETANKQRQSPKTNDNPSLPSFLTEERSDEDRERIKCAMVAQCPGDDEAWHDWLRAEFARVGVDTDAEWETCTKYRRKKKRGAPMREDFVGWLLNAAVKKQGKGGPVKPPRRKGKPKAAGPDGVEIELAYAEAFHAGQVGEGEEAAKEWRRRYVEEWRKRAEAQPSGPKIVRDEFQEMKDELEREQAAAGKVIPIAAAQPLAAAS